MGIKKLTIGGNRRQYDDNEKIIRSASSLIINNYRLMSQRFQDPDFYEGVR